MKRTRFSPPRIVMLLENNPCPQEVGVRNEAEELTRGGYEVRVILPRSPGQRRRVDVQGVHVSPSEQEGG